MTFPVSGVEVFPLWPFLTALVVSFATSMGGVSGAFLLLPYQVTVLGFDTPAVSSTNMLFNVVAIPSGIYRYVRERRMLWPLAVVLVAGTLPGVLVGMWIRIRYLPDPRTFKLFVGIVLLYLGVRMFWSLVGDMRGWIRRSKGRGEDGASGEPDGCTETGGAGTRGRDGNDGASTAADDEESCRVKTTSIGAWRIEFTYRNRTHRFNPVVLGGLAAVVGVLGGIYGIGGGSLMAPLLVSVFGLPVHTIAGAALSATFAASVVGVAGYAWLAPGIAGPDTAVVPDWMLGGLLGAGGLVGMYLGALTQKYIPAWIIKIVLCAVLVVIAVRYVVQFFL